MSQFTAPPEELEDNEPNLPQPPHPRALKNIAVNAVAEVLGQSDIAEDDSLPDGNDRVIVITGKS